MRLTMFLNASNIFYEKRFGLRHIYSNTDAIFEIIEKIKQACKLGQYACWVFLDAQKAFDIVNHDILLKNSTIMESRE